MADMPNDFWSGWITIITVVSLVALAWLVYSIYFSYDGRDLEEKKAPVWDDDLREGHNAPPMWWFWFLFAGMIFSVIYLML